VARPLGAGGPDKGKMNSDTGLRNRAILRSGDTGWRNTTL